VVGDVHKSTSVVMEDTGPTTVLKALATAEGVNPTASLHKAKIIRKGENGPTEVPVDIKEILSGKAPDVTLQADDILFVPRSAGKSARKPQNQDFYDVPPSDPLQDPTPIYIR
jgi:polysaccharide export outer membrane protein